MSDLRAGGRPREQGRPASTMTHASPRAVARPVPTTTATRPLSPVRDGLPAPTRKPRPDPGPLRIAIGLTGLATASALMTAFLNPATGADAATGAAATSTVTIVPGATPDPVHVRHVVQYVQLKPGQTAPPKAVVKQAPAPKPRVVVVTTKQSGKP